MEALAKGFGTLANNFETGAYDFDILPNDVETLAKDFETITRGRWEWKSNFDPWPKTEPAQWEPYSLEHNYLIEKAYYDKKGEVDIGDYIVSIKHMIQKKKGYVTKQRPIRRINWIDSMDEKDRSDRYLETESPKTINKVFGSLGDFISFFSRRNQEILDFANHFKELEQSNDLTTLNQRIIPRLISCFEEVLLKPNEEQLKDSSLSQLKKKMLLNMKKQIEELIYLFKREFSSFEEFYGNILRAYTMNTDLYPILNNYLRNENWVEVDKLLPYAFCLCKAFFDSRPKTNSIQDDQSIESQALSSRLLYRGTAFDKCTLSFYNREKVQYFSWNSVTSTSKNKKIAEDFMYRNTDPLNKKYPVLFVIEIPLASEFESEYLKWVDIHQYSVIPKEDEVVLPPGSAFELIETYTNKDELSIIKLKLRVEIKSLAHGGMMMQGMLQSQMATEKVVKIMCLKGEELSQALMNLWGNKLIEEIEFCLCTFDKQSLRKMFKGLPTLEEVKKLKFIACMHEDNGEIAIEGCQEGERCKVVKIGVIETNNFFQMICNESWNQQYWDSLRELDLDFRSKRGLTDQELNYSVSQRLKYLPQLTYFNINCEECEQITDDGVDSLAKALSSLAQLTSLNLHFHENSEITDLGVYSLPSHLSCLTQLTHLNLDLGESEPITDEFINRFTRALSSLPQLTRFVFHLGLWKQIKDKVNSLVKLLRPLTQLTHLNFNFDRVKISNEVIISLVKNLNSFTQLTHLDLVFFESEEITDEGVNSFAEGLSSLTQLTHLTLKKIEDLFWYDCGNRYPDVPWEMIGKVMEFF